MRIYHSTSFCVSDMLPYIPDTFGMSSQPLDPATYGNDEPARPKYIELLGKPSNAWYCLMTNVGDTFFNFPGLVPPP